MLRAPCLSVLQDANSTLHSCSFTSLSSFWAGGRGGQAAGGSARGTTAVLRQTAGSVGAWGSSSRRRSARGGGRRAGGGVATRAAGGSSCGGGGRRRRNAGCLMCPQLPCFATGGCKQCDAVDHRVSWSRMGCALAGACGGRPVVAASKAHAWQSQRHLVPPLHAPARFFFMSAALCCISDQFTRKPTQQQQQSGAMSTRGFLGMFSKAAPAADVTKLKPGIALPHVTLPTTEVRNACRPDCRTWGQPGMHESRPRLKAQTTGLGVGATTASQQTGRCRIKRLQAAARLPASSAPLPNACPHPP